MTQPYAALGWGITRIETGFHRAGLASCYLLVRNGEAALIDTGTARTSDAILELLRRLQIDATQLRYVIPTHVHLDHAGGSGQLMRHFPNATLVVHPDGARHLIDPGKLAAGSQAVYGEAEFRRHFLELVPVDEARVVRAHDGLEVELGGTRLTCIDTPGHARHHIVVHDPLSNGLFTGDTYGIAYPELATDKGPFPFLPSTPVQFDPGAWHTTIDRLLARGAARAILTHYGQIEQSAEYAATLHAQIDAYVGIATLHKSETERYSALHAALWRYYDALMDAHGCRLDRPSRAEILDMDIGLCAQGLDVWLQRQAA